MVTYSLTQWIMWLKAKKQNTKKQIEIHKNCSKIEILKLQRMNIIVKTIKTKWEEKFVLL